MDTELSDLFFNLPHTNYSALFGEHDSNPTSDEMRLAVLKDAIDALECYPRTFAGCDSVDMAADFMGRL